MWMLLYLWKTHPPPPCSICCTVKARSFFLKKSNQKRNPLKDTDVSCKKARKQKVFLTKQPRESARNNLVRVESTFMCLTPASNIVLFHLEEVCV